MAQASRAAAKVALETYTWSAAARDVAQWVDDRHEQKRARGAAPPMLVASSLPPDESGVAFYTQRSLSAPTRRVSFFAPVRSALGLESIRDAVAQARHEVQGEPHPVDVFGLDSLEIVRTNRPDAPVLFVLGNSHHHVATLEFLLSRGARPADLVHLHDVFLGGLLVALFETEAKLRAALEGSYPRQKVTEWLQRGGSSHGGPGGLLGPRLLVEKGGVRRFLVNSEAARRALIDDLGDDVGRAEIEVGFLPILPKHPRPVVPDPTMLRLGHFGIIGRTKQPDLLIAACDLLAEKRSLRLTFAGYGVKQAVRVFGIERDYIVTEESPSTQRLQELMEEVDCAVQLRHPDHGESSGVVNQLLALRRPVVCTTTGSALELADALHLVSPDISAAELSNVIERASESPWPASADALITGRSPVVLEHKLRELLALDSPVESGL
jgi:glycosyltransferase involved in cell wall biosynthesis